MTEYPKPAFELTEKDTMAFPVWKMSDRYDDDTYIEPELKFPVADAEGKLFAIEVFLANGMRNWALLANVDGLRPVRTKHLLAVSLLKDGKWHSLARYFDFDREENGPAAIAARLGLMVEDVFPISYDLTSLVNGSSDALLGEVLQQPEVPLSESEIFDLVFSS